MNHIADIEYSIMCHCVKAKGSWWANHFFRNKEVNEMYSKIRRMSLTDVYQIIEGKL